MWYRSCRATCRVFWLSMETRCRSTAAPGTTTTTGDSGKTCPGSGGQAQDGDLSLIYGRVFPPPEAADPEQFPGFVGALGPDGPLGYSTDVQITETNDAQGQPRTIDLRARSTALTLDLRFEVASIETTRMAQGPTRQRRQLSADARAVHRHRTGGHARHPFHRSRFRRNLPRTVDPPPTAARARAWPRSGHGGDGATATQACGLAEASPGCRSSL